MLVKEALPSIVFQIIDKNDGACFWDTLSSAGTSAVGKEKEQCHNSRSAASHGASNSAPIKKETNDDDGEYIFKEKATNVTR